MGESVKLAALELEAERAEEGEEAYNFFTSQQEWQEEEAGGTEAKEGGREEEKEGGEEKEDEVFAKLQVTICFVKTQVCNYRPYLVGFLAFENIFFLMAEIIRNRGPPSWSAKMFEVMSIACFKYM